MVRTFFCTSLLTLPVAAWPQTNSEADSLYTLATELSGEDLYSEAVENYYSALHIYEEEKDTAEMIKTYNSLGLTYQKMSDIQSAYRYLNAASEILKKYEDKKLKSYVLNNLGMLKEDTQEHDSALVYYHESLALKQGLQDSAAIAHTLNNISVVLLSKGNYRASLDYCLQSKIIKKAISDTAGLATAFMNIANLYGYLGKMDSVKWYLDRGIPFARASRSPIYLSGFYKNYSELYRYTGKHDSALIYMDSVMITENRVFDEKLASEVAQYQTLYNLEKKELQLEQQRFENKLLRQKEKQSRQQKILLLVIAVALLIILLLVFLMLRSNKRASRNKQDLLDKKLELKSKELMANSNLILHKQELLNDIKTLLRGLQKRHTDIPDEIFREIDDKFRQDLNKEHDWEKFKIHFEQIHEDFFEKLKSDFPRLTESDTRHCAYIKIGLTTKEIASTLNIHPSSVQRSRVRLKKKLGLDRSQNLQDFIRSFQ